MWMIVGALCHITNRHHISQVTSLHKWKKQEINHKFLIGNRFHNTTHRQSYHLIQIEWNWFPIKNLWLIPCFFHLWSEVTWIQICASLNHRKKVKAEPSWLIPLTPMENIELFITISAIHIIIVTLLMTSHMFFSGMCAMLQHTQLVHLHHR